MNPFAWKSVIDFEDNFWKEFFKVWGIYLIVGFGVQVVHAALLGNTNARLIAWLYNLLIFFAGMITHCIVFGATLKISGARFKDGFYPLYSYIFFGLLCWAFLLVAGIINLDYSLCDWITWTLLTIGLIIGIIATLKLVYSDLRGLALPIIGAIIGWFTGFVMIKIIEFLFRNVTITVLV